MYNAIFDSLIIGKKVIYLPSCHSTNDIAAELVLAGSVEEGTIVITDNQLKGRGQRGADWHSEASKNLTFSIILSPHFIPIGDQFLISQMTSVAICNYLSAYTSNVTIKWPNDIYINLKKASGTLIENIIHGSSIKYAIVGIGVNINQIKFDNPRSVSLANAVGYQFSLQPEFYKLVHFLDAAYVRLKSMQSRNSIRLEYQDHLLGYQTWRTFRSREELITGKVTGITAAGRLCLQVEGESQVKEFDLKEIEWIWNE